MLDSSLQELSALCNSSVISMGGNLFLQFLLFESLASSSSVVRSSFDPSDVVLVKKLFLTM